MKTDMIDYVIQFLYKLGGPATAELTWGFKVWTNFERTFAKGFQVPLLYIILGLGDYVGY